MSRYCIALVVLLWAVSSAAAVALGESSPAADALLRRVVPTHADQFVTEIIPRDDGSAQNDVFELDSADNRIILRGSSPVAIAAALNWYLKYACHCQISWCGSNL